MRRISYWVLCTVSTLVLLFSYHTSTSSGTGTSVQAAAVPGPAATGATGTTSGTSSDTSGGASSSTGSSASTSTTASTYAGSVVPTRFGDVQVQITVASGKITAVDVLAVPSENPRDQEINSQAVPILNSETLSAQSASIDMVSGATYTSDGYIQSLQAALDAAHI